MYIFFFINFTNKNLSHARDHLKKKIHYYKSNYNACDKFLLAESTKNIPKMVNFTNLKTSYGHIVKLKPYWLVCKWPKPEE